MRPNELLTWFKASQFVTISTTSVVWSVVVLCLPLKADDDSSAVLLKKMIEAKGGAALVKVQAYRFELRSELQVAGKKVALTGSSLVSGLDRGRLEFTDPPPFVSVLNKDAGWIRENEKTRAMTAAEIVQTRDSLFLSWVSTTLPKASGVVYTRLPEKTEAGQRMLGVKASKQGFSEIEIWVDAETFRPVCQRFDSNRPDGTIAKMDTRFLEFKTIGGIVLATRSTTYRNGEKWMDTEVLDAKFFTDASKLEFAKPE